MLFASANGNIVVHLDFGASDQLPVFVRGVVKHLKTVAGDGDGDLGHRRLYRIHLALEGGGQKLHVCIQLMEIGGNHAQKRYRISIDNILSAGL